MSQRALKAAPEVTEVPETDRPRAESPATRLLDAMRAGDDAAVLAACAETTSVTAENMSWSARGPDEIERMLVAARRRFPGLTFESRTRHVGFGLVIEEARVQDAAFGPSAAGDEPSADVVVVADDRPHPMWDEPATERRSALSIWRDRTSVDEPAVPLNMPVRVAVRHDDLQVHDVTLSFPAALLKRALGLRVDPFEMSLSEVQSAFIAPVGAGFTTHTLARPDLAAVTPRPLEPTPAGTAVHAEPPRRRRGRVVVPVLLALLAVVGGVGWYAVQGSTAGNVAAPVDSSSPEPTHTSTPSSSSSPSSTPSASKPPKVIESQPSGGPTRKPNVTLTSEFAFAFNSATLSPSAKTAIAKVARQVRNAGLAGKIFVDGYTDNLGSAAYGLDLSKRRAAAVAGFLQTQLLGAPVSIVSVGHGEAGPIASNATAAGRAKNRRVTITLPKP